MWFSYIIAYLYIRLIICVAFSLSGFPFIQTNVGGSLGKGTLWFSSMGWEYDRWGLDSVHTTQLYFYGWTFRSHYSKAFLVDAAIRKRRLCLLVSTENILKTEIFQNDCVTIIVWFSSNTNHRGRGIGMIKWRKTESFNFLPPESNLETTNGFPYQWSICSYRMSALFFDFPFQK